MTTAKGNALGCLARQTQGVSGRRRDRTMITKTQPKINPQWYDCDACDDGFEASTPPEPGRKLYEIHGCFRGKRKAQLDAITCKHCAALTGGLRCGCPEAIAQLKADDDASNKKNKEDNARYELEQARFEKERADKRRKDDAEQAEDMRQMFDAGRKEAQRTKRVTDLEDRELAQKEKVMARRESHQEADADAEGQVEGGEPLEAFVGRMAEADATPPSALLRRSDGEILFYDGEVNWCFGEPGGGKSWLGLYVVQESILRGQRTVFWDHEMSPGQTKARCQALGLDLVEAERDGSFLYLKPYAEQSALAMSQAQGMAAGERRAGAGGH